MSFRKVYLSGPISGIPEGNEPVFKALADDLTAGGYEAVNPHDLGRFVPDVHPWHAMTARQRWRAYMDVCVKAIPDCSKVVMLRGWRWSSGARVEHQLAKGLGLNIHYVGGFLGGFFR